MTTEQKSQLKALFLEAWNNPEVPSTEIHTYLTEQALAKNLIPEGAVLTAEAVRASYATIKEGDYTNYRTRPRKVKSAFVVDFTEGDPGDEQEVNIQIQTAEPVTTQPQQIGDEDELDSEVIEEPEEVLVDVTETVKQNFNW